MWHRWLFGGSSAYLHDSYLLERKFSKSKSVQELSVVTQLNFISSEPFIITVGLHVEPEWERERERGEERRREERRERERERRRWMPDKPELTEFVQNILYFASHRRCCFTQCLYMCKTCNPASFLLVHVASCSLFIIIRADSHSGLFFYLCDIVDDLSMTHH